MSGTVLIVGASGLVGTAAVNAFASAGWRVIAASRRRPVFTETENYSHIALDLQDAAACNDAAAQLTDVTHVVYTAVYELPGLVAGWSDPHQIETNGRMLRNLLEPLRRQAKLRHITLLQGTKAYGASVKPMRVPAREDQPRVEHPNFYWLQEDYLREVCSGSGPAFTILRPQLIVGPNYGVVMNLPPVLGAYAAIRKAEGKPFSFPGGADWVWEAADVRLVADACVWAATAAAAANETFNLTNGEVFLWRDMWPAIADTMGVATGPDEPSSVAAYLGKRADLWAEIVANHGLQRIAFADLLGESHHYADLCLAVGADRPPPPTFVSTVKIRQAGFNAAYNSEQSFCHWLQVLQRQRILPTP